MNCLSTQKVYENLKDALIRDVESKNKNHDLIFSYVVGMLSAIEDMDDIEIIGDKIILDDKTCTE